MTRETDSETREASQPAEWHELTDLEIKWVSGGAIDVFMPLPPTHGE